MTRSCPIRRRAIRLGCCSIVPMRIATSIDSSTRLLTVSLRRRSSSRRGWRRADAQLSVHLTVARRRGIVGRLQLFEDGGGTRVIGAAAVGQRDAAGRAVQQRRADALFERVNQPRDGGGGDAQLPRGG